MRSDHLRDCDCSDLCLIRIRMKMSLPSRVVFYRIFVSKESGARAVLLPLLVSSSTAVVFGALLPLLVLVLMLLPSLRPLAFLAKFSSVAFFAAASTSSSLSSSSSVCASSSFSSSSSSSSSSSAAAAALLSFSRRSSRSRSSSSSSSSSSYTHYEVQKFGGPDNLSVIWIIFFNE